MVYFIMLHAQLYFLFVFDFPEMVAPYLKCIFVWGSIKFLFLFLFLFFIETISHFIPSKGLGYIKYISGIRKTSFIKRSHSVVHLQVRVFAGMEPALWGGKREENTYINRDAVGLHLCHISSSKWFATTDTHDAAQRNVVARNIDMSAKGTAAIVKTMNMTIFIAYQPVSHDNEYEAYNIEASRSDRIRTKL